MNSGFLSRRRGSLIITIAILKTAKKGAKKTHFLYSVSLSYGQLVRYLEFLKDNDFITEFGDLYKTTKKGLQLIDEFESSPLTRSIVAT